MFQTLNTDDEEMSSDGHYVSVMKGLLKIVVAVSLKYPSNLRLTLINVCKIWHPRDKLRFRKLIMYQLTFL